MMLGKKMAGKIGLEMLNSHIKYLDELRVDYLPQDCKEGLKSLKPLVLLMKVEI